MQTAANTARNHFPNAVGYTTVAVKKNTITAFGVQFQTLNGATEIPIKNLITVATPQSGFNMTGADSMQVWNSAEGKFKFYYNRRNVGWVADGSTKVTEDTVKEGDGVYFKRLSSASDTTISITGKVNVSDPNFPITITKNSITFLCNPWPVEFPISDFHSMVAAPQTGFNMTGSDSIQVWDPGNGETQGKYTFYYDRRNVGYVKDGETKITNETIKPGAAVMFKRLNSATDTTIIFPKPAGL